jgi:hypothetical protein
MANSFPTAPPTRHGWGWATAGCRLVEHGGLRITVQDLYHDEDVSVSGHRTTLQSLETVRVTLCEFIVI